MNQSDAYEHDMHTVHRMFMHKTCTACFMHMHSMFMHMHSMFMHMGMHMHSRDRLL
jgi:hypothetical protein